ncbi:MAG TPA: 5'-nucleosidase [Steroidobacteraceae bacterium]|nr:5'-nucleosidase [Steroidobacteraceae bacterium]
MAGEFPPVLAAMALPAEGAGRFEAAGIPVLYTGIGKVNAAVALTRALARYQEAGYALPLVANFGTAGSARIAPRTLVSCRRFLDRDMDVGALGFAPGVTPFDPLPPMLEFGAHFGSLPDAVCGSGDSFATRAHDDACDVVDMEAYALAKACRIAGAEFACAKYVSDSADAAAARHWKDNVAGAAGEFVKLYLGLVSPASRASRA